MFPQIIGERSGELMEIGPLLRVLVGRRAGKWRGNVAAQGFPEIVYERHLEHAREVEGRRVGPLEGDMTESESRTAAGYLQRSMSKEKRAEYDFCFQASGSEQFLFALVRQPSFLKAEGLEQLLDEWVRIKKSSGYKQAVAQSKKRTEEQTKQKAELQSLRIRINRLRRKDEDTEDFLLELEDKEKNYRRGKQELPPGATNQTFTTE